VVPIPDFIKLPALVNLLESEISRSFLVEGDITGLKILLNIPLSEIPSA